MVPVWATNVKILNRKSFGHLFSMDTSKRLCVNLISHPRDGQQFVRLCTVQEHFWVIV